MNLKIQEQQIHETRQRIWLHNQYLTTLKEQQAVIFDATPATRDRCQKRIAETQRLLSQEADQLARQTAALVASIDAISDARIREILTRRYLNKQPFKAIAAAIGYDLRWVYRLHQQGLAQIEQPPQPGPKVAANFRRAAPDSYLPNRYITPFQAICPA